MIAGCSPSRWQTTLLLAALALPVAAEAPADVRVALVIGNAAYEMAPLTNPVNDARAIGAALESMGFKVFEINNASRAQMEAAITSTGEALRGQHGIGLLFFAGHGLQVDWHNYMVPVDARLTNVSAVAGETVDVQTVLDAFTASGNRVNIVVLDACRDNPFGNATSGKGLAPMNAPADTLLAYSTAPGNVADDGAAEAGHGLYTQYLVRELKVPDARIEDVFKRVRLEVRRHSDGRQVPWESTSLEDDFYFRPPVPRVSQESSKASFDEQKADWDRIRASREAADFYAYLQKYPNGLISEQAQFRLDQLENPKLRETLPQGVRASLLSGERRFRVGDRIVYRRSDLFSGAARPDANLVVTLSNDERVELNGGQRVLDPMGNLVTDGEGTRSPAKVRFPAELSIGKRWQTAYKFFGAGNKPPTELVWTYRVTAFEELEVPVGVRQAYRIEGTSTSTSGYRQTERYWIDPQTFGIVKDEHAEYAPDGHLSSSNKLELLRYEPAAR
jgi:hypothetical protein